MPAPKNPVTGPATAGKIHKAQERKAAELTAVGWVPGRSNSYAVETYSFGVEGHAVLYDYRDSRSLTAFVRVADVDFLADSEAAKARAVEAWRRFESVIRVSKGQDTGDGLPHVTGCQNDFFTDEVVIKVSNRKV